MTERQGVEIDYCPQCRGVWLDRGELDKIIERAAKEGIDPPGGVQQGEPRPPLPRNRNDDDRRDDDRYDRHDRDEKRRYKRKSFWTELFDFD
jgi:Zn-finger nucleic acid-binding protein